MQVTAVVVVPPAQQALRVRQALRGKMVQQAHKDLRDRQVQQDNKASKA
jgi:hypothetical protein